jgi:hypothetical protein
MSIELKKWHFEPAELSWAVGKFSKKPFFASLPLLQPIREIKRCPCHKQGLTLIRWRWKEPKPITVKGLLDNGSCFSTPNNAMMMIILRTTTEQNFRGFEHLYTPLHVKSFVTFLVAATKKGMTS